jgi:ubiquinone/menaquinone biosynthesis C-methylase UbiE
MADERRRVVRDGYEQVAAAYLAHRPRDGADVAWLDDLVAAVAPGGRVLDAGCGAGEPVTPALLGAGLEVVGVDCAAAQLALAARLAGPLTLAQGDLAALPLADASVDGVVSYYAVIHVPRDDHPRVFDEVRRVLRPGGTAVLCLGARDLPEDHDPASWLGPAMYWSHFDADTNLALLEAHGLAVQRAARVPDPMEHGEHLFVVARRR